MIPLAMIVGDKLRDRPSEVLLARAESTGSDILL